MLTGYTDKFSVAAGERVHVMTSSNEPEVQAKIVRLRPGPPSDATMPSFEEDVVAELGTAAGGVQATLTAFETG